MNEPTDNALGRAVASRRSALGLKRKDLAERSRLSYPYISEIENGLKEPSAKALRQIAEGLDLTVAELASLSESVGATPGAVPRVTTAALVNRVPARTIAEIRSSRSNAGLEPTDDGPSLPESPGLAYFDAAESAIGSNPLHELVRAEVERQLSDRLPALVEREVARVLEELGDGDPS